MRKQHLWNRAKQLKICTAPEITGGFSVGFDSRVPEETKDLLMQFVYWVDDNFSVPVTLWVDFKYNHYLVNHKKEQVGYRFYWVDFSAYPVFENPDDIPVIELPVRMEHWTPEEVLTSFIEAISQYFVWLMGKNVAAYVPDPEEIEEVLQAYLQDCSE